jgi:hypothetical protein
MELENVNPTSENIVSSKINHVNLLVFEKGKN